MTRYAVPTVLAILTLTVLLTAPGPVLAADVGDTVVLGGGTTVWSGLVNVTAPVSVNASETLEILPGTVVNITGTWTFEVFGDIRAEGVEFVADPDWEGVLIYGNATFVNCTFTGGRNALVADGGEVTVTGSTFTDMSNHALRAVGRSNIALEGTSISRCNVGLSLVASNATLSESGISDCAAGISARSSTVYLERSVISDCVLGVDADTTLLDMVNSTITGCGDAAYLTGVSFGNLSGEIYGNQRGVISDTLPLGGTYGAIEWNVSGRGNGEYSLKLVFDLTLDCQDPEGARMRSNVTIYNLYGEIYNDTTDLLGHARVSLEIVVVDGNGSLTSGLPLYITASSSYAGIRYYGQRSVYIPGRYNVTMDIVSMPDEYVYTPPRTEDDEPEEEAGGDIMTTLVFGVAAAALLVVFIFIAALKKE